MEEEIESNNTDSSEDSIEIRVNSIHRPVIPAAGPRLSKRKSFIPKKIVRRSDVTGEEGGKRARLEGIEAPQSEPLALVVCKTAASDAAAIPPPVVPGYKNMTPQRRVEANARERQRVHTITNAFDRLQSAIPGPESASKLSKLSVIKIATAYIMVLSRMVGMDYSPDGSAPSVEACISACQELIESESRFKARRRS